MSVGTIQIVIYVFLYFRFFLTMLYRSLPQEKKIKKITRAQETHILHIIYYYFKWLRVVIHALHYNTKYDLYIILYKKIYLKRLSLVRHPAVPMRDCVNPHPNTPRNRSPPPPPRLSSFIHNIIIPTSTIVVSIT